MPGLLDPFVPECDARERHATNVRAPAELVYRVARELDLHSVPLIRFTFWMRGRLMRATPTRREPQAFLDEMQALGWSCLLEKPGEHFVAGAACQPWLANVVFTPLPADRFREYSETNRVKIAWTLEAHPRGVALTELATETRAVATDGEARMRFRRYWRWARLGIVPIRWLMLADDPPASREALAR